MNPSYCIGLMSGTSLDGVDLVYVKLDNTNKWHSEILQAKTYEYPKEWLEKLKLAFDEKPNELTPLSKAFGSYLGTLVKQFQQEFLIDKIDFVASHGHTIFHKPEEGFTLQIGDGEALANAAQQTVVCDFRTADVLLGGQGAPLVPIGDAYLFADYDFCLNLGGFANVSFDMEGERLAYDICPVNIVLNYFMRSIGKEYDAGGVLAKTGKINQDLLAELNADSFFKAPIPKSLGFEFVTKNVLPVIEKHQLDLSDILRTYIEHVAFQLSRALDNNPQKNVLATGGGVYNQFLIERLQSYTATQIHIPTSDLVDFKEALIFALLGKLKLEGEVNCLKSVTGASKNHSSGKISYPK